MIEVVEKKSCCGCSACQEICPKKCIKMQEDEEGFLYPAIDRTKCIDCGLCEKTCPIQHQYEPDNIEIEAYAMYAKNEERIQSSSGGIFGTIAKTIIDQGGMVCGASYNQNFDVEHVIAEDEATLSKLRGSKYTQSSNNGIFQQIREALKNGRTVLYSGTACQVAGLKKYLGRDFENLYTIDVLCHGVPSPRLWRKYIDQLQKKREARITRVNMRNKDNGWKSYHIKIDFDNGTSLYEEHHKNIYMKLFLSDICLRPSCHDCRYKSMNRPSDMTLGDYWGIEKQLPELDDNKGISIVKINTDKGKDLFELVEKQLVYKEVSLDIALPNTADSRRSVKQHPRREKFFKQFDNWTIEKLMRLIEPSLARKVVSKLKYIKKKII